MAGNAVPPTHIILIAATQTAVFLFFFIPIGFIIPLAQSNNGAGAFPPAFNHTKLQKRNHSITIIHKQPRPDVAKNRVRPWGE